MDIIAKYGREMFTNGGLGLELASVDRHMANVANFMQASTNGAPNYVTIVASVATEAGRKEWHDVHGDLAEPSEQMLAMMGQALGAVILQDSLRKFGIVSASVNVTHNEIDNRKEQPVYRKSLVQAKASRIVPIVNENAALSVVELAKLAYGGDNDGIAGHSARVTGADALILFTVKGGYLDNNGREVPRIETSDFDEALALVQIREQDSSATKKGKGGMSSKMQEARKTSDAGIATFIAGPEATIEDVLAGRSGTEVIGKATEVG